MYHFRFFFFIYLLLSILKGGKKRGITEQGSRLCFNNGRKTREENALYLQIKRRALQLQVAKISQKKKT